MKTHDARVRRTITRLAPALLILLILAEWWFVSGLDRHPWLFTLMAIGIPALAVTAACGAGWLTKENLRKTWGRGPSS